jgi:hypothetical protein
LDIFTYDSWVKTQDRQLSNAEITYLDQVFGYLHRAPDGISLARALDCAMVMANESDWGSHRLPNTPELYWRNGWPLPITIGVFFDQFRRGAGFAIDREVQQKWNSAVEHPTLHFPPVRIKEPFAEWKLIKRHEAAPDVV